MHSRVILFQINLPEKVAKFEFVIADKFRKIYDQKKHRPRKANSEVNDHVLFTNNCSAFLQRATTHKLHEINTKQRIIYCMRVELAAVA